MKTRTHSLDASPEKVSAEPSAASGTTLVLPVESHPAAAVRRRHGVVSRGWLRRVHALGGVIAALNLLLLIATGLLLQHRETFRLDERIVNRRLLPANYRVQDGPEGVRADIVVTDLHSGRLFGRIGALVLDGITLGWLMLLATGVVMYAAGFRRNGAGPPANSNGQSFGKRSQAS